jgi:hypothetical protein
MTPLERANAVLHLEKTIASQTFSKSLIRRELLRYLGERTLANDLPALRRSSILKAIWGQSASRGGTVRVAVHMLNAALRRYYQSEGLNDEIEIGIGTVLGENNTQASYLAWFGPHQAARAPTSIVLPPIPEQELVLEERLIRVIAPAAKQRLAEMILTDLLSDAPLGSGIATVAMSRFSSVLLYFTSPVATTRQLQLLLDVGWLEDAFGYPVDGLQLTKPHDEELQRIQSPILSYCATPILFVPPEQYRLQARVAITSTTLDRLEKPFRLQMIISTAPNAMTDFTTTTIDRELSFTERFEIPLEQQGNAGCLVQVGFRESIEQKTALQKTAAALKALVGILPPIEAPLYTSFYITAASPDHIDLRVQIVPC